MNVYVDGFNLYYGAVKDTPHEWLNVQRLFEMLRPHDDVRTIWYFTAEIAGPNRPNQTAYLSALATLPKVEIVLGRFKLKRVRCGVEGCNHPGRRVFQIPEEKRTDVQIALRMLNDAWRDACDGFVLVSGDSDLVPAVRAVKEVAPAKPVIVYIPSRHIERSKAFELRSAADRARVLPNALIPRCQFPPVIPDGSGGLIAKPPGW